jgi:hypothetical protein
MTPRRKPVPKNDHATCLNIFKRGSVQKNSSLILLAYFENSTLGQEVVMNIKRKFSKDLIAKTQLCIHKPRLSDSRTESDTKIVIGMLTIIFLNILRPDAEVTQAMLLQHKTLNNVLTMAKIVKETQSNTKK